MGSWWGIRPDSTGPNYDPVEWAMTGRIHSNLTAALADSDRVTLEFLKAALARHWVATEGLAPARTPEVADGPLTFPRFDPKNPDQIGNMPFAASAGRALSARGDVRRGEAPYQIAIVRCVPHDFGPTDAARSSSRRDRQAIQARGNPGVNPRAESEVGKVVRDGGSRVGGWKTGPGIPRAGREQGSPFCVGRTAWSSR
jgi:hypothetical protein